VNTPSRGAWPGIRCVLLGFIAVFALSLGTDQLLHSLKVYPPWGEPMYDTGLNLLALSYRLVYGVLGGYIIAKLAPHTPMKFVWIGAVLGLVLATMGAIGAKGQNLGPMWMPVVLAVTAIPTTWLGGLLYLRRQPAR
jgi:hypothetical protein